MALRRALIFALAIFALDRATKFWIVEALDLKRVYFIEVVDPFLNLTMAWNRGVNFGLFDYGHAGRWVLVTLAVAVSAGLLWWVRRQSGWRVPLAVGAIAGGAIGNAWDRVQYGAVADFFNMSCCGIVNPFAFNVADVAIFAGAVGLILFAPERPKAGDKDAAPVRPTGREKA
jgi:signal peptidase II